jgi:hypothetical protein
MHRLWFGKIDNIIIIILFCSKNPYLVLQPSDIEQVNNYILI